MRDFRPLLVWEKAHQLTLKIYKTTTSFPKDEMYGLTSQIRRACASMPANIVEGCGRDSNPELARFLQIAGGCACELEYHLLLGHDLGLIEAENYAQLNHNVVEIKRMLYAFIQKLKADT